MKQRKIFLSVISMIIGCASLVACNNKKPVATEINESTKDTCEVIESYYPTTSTTTTEPLPSETHEMTTESIATVETTEASEAKEVEVEATDNNENKDEGSSDDMDSRSEDNEATDGISGEIFD